MWRKWYRETVRQLDSTRRELESFKENVFEKEIIKEKDAKIHQLEMELAVSRAKVDSLLNCNCTITNALANISKK